MSDPLLPSVDDDEAPQDTDLLPPEHPASQDPTVSAGEVISGEGTGTAVTGAPQTGETETPT